MNYLIAGLGNIGPDYAHTRHNIGFDIGEQLCREMQSSFQLDRHAMHASFPLKNKKVHLILPTTYMNLSGKAVKYWMDECKIPRHQVLIVLDDLALPFGTIRVKKKGSDGGHNGLRSIDASLQSNDYARLRFGIGNQFEKGKQVNFVLGKWQPEEEKELPFLIQRSVDCIRSFILEGPDICMNKFNG